MLIHINHDQLGSIYDLMAESARRYICIVEYYNPTPVSVCYSGHYDRLYKRDFAGEMLEGLAGLKLIDYGFCYHRDPNFPQDDATWFLMEKI